MANISENHEAYAADYDDQVRAYACNIADLLFGMCYAYIQPGMRLMDAGIGTGLSAELFAKAGLNVTGMDFSPAMLEICRIKEIATELIRHDLSSAPWPVEQGAYDLVICCGVMHFISDPAVIFEQARRSLRAGGWFGFTTKVCLNQTEANLNYRSQVSDEFEIFSHSEQYLETLLRDHLFVRVKRERCFVGEDLFYLWVVQKNNLKG